MGARLRERAGGGLSAVAELPWWKQALHLVVLSSFAIAAPVFQVTDVQFYIGRDVTGMDVVWIAIALIVVPALVVVAVVRLAALASPRVGAAMQLAFVGLLAAAFVAAPLAQLDLPLAVHAAVALTMGALVLAAYAGTTWTKSVLTALAPAPILFCAFFLLTPPLSDYVFADESEVSLVPAAPAASSSVPVVMVVFDEFPGYALMDERGRIDRRRYPNFARLARTSTWYPNATTSRSDTEVAVPSVVTGRDAPLDSLPIAADHPHSVFTLLGRSHRVHVSEPWTDLCPERLCPETSERSFRERVGPVLESMPAILGQIGVPDAEEHGVARPLESGAPDRNVQFAEFLHEIGPAEKPALHYLHILFPHKPWRYLPSGKAYSSDVGRDDWLGGLDDWGGDPTIANAHYQRFMLQLGHVDRLIGELIERLRRAGLYRQALVVVTADHGVSFRADEPRRDATQANAADILSIPLFVKTPGQDTGRVDEGFARAVDVLPTVADALDAEQDWNFDGVSLLAPGVPQRPLRIENVDGGEIELDHEEYVRARDAALRRQIRLFGSGEASLFAFGPHPDLVGRSPRPLVAARGEATAEVIDGEILRDYRLGAGGDGTDYVPARVAGTIDGLEPGVPVAIAINGEIAATTRSYDGDDGTEYAAMVPHQLARPGPNALRIFTIEGEGRSLVLHPLELSW